MYLNDNYVTFQILKYKAKIKFVSVSCSSRVKMKHSGLFRGCLSSVNVLGSNKDYVQSIREQKELEVKQLHFETSLGALGDIHEERFYITLDCNFN